MVLVICKSHSRCRSMKMPKYLFDIASGISVFLSIFGGPKLGKLLLYEVNGNYFVLSVVIVCLSN